MKDEQVNYFKELGMRTPLIERIEEIMQFFAQICTEEIEDVFVCEYIEKDGTRIYEDIRFFSDNYVMRAQDFVNSDNFNMVKKQSCEMYGIKIEKTEYDYKKATTKSRMIITPGFRTGHGGKLRASGENCDRLKTLIAKIYLPRISNNE